MTVNSGMSSITNYERESHILAVSHTQLHTNLDIQKRRENKLSNKNTTLALLAEKRWTSNVYKASMHKM